MAPEESIYTPETSRKWAALALVNLPDGGHMSFIFRKFDHDGDDYKQEEHFISLYRDEAMEIGILLRSDQASPEASIDQIHLAQASLVLSTQQIDFSSWKVMRF